MNRLAVNKSHHKTLIRWITKNVVNGKILKLSLESMNIQTPYVLNFLTQDDPQSQMARTGMNQPKLTSENLQKRIAKATLYATVPPALIKAPIVAKIYGSGYKNVFSELERYNKSEYARVANNIMKITEGKSIDSEPTPSPKPDPKQKDTEDKKDPSTKTDPKQKDTKDKKDPSTKTDSKQKDKKDPSIKIDPKQKDPSPTPSTEVKKDKKDKKKHKKHRKEPSLGPSPTPSPNPSPIPSPSVVTSNCSKFNTKPIKQKKRLYFLYWRGYNK